MPLRTICTASRRRSSKGAAKPLRLAAIKTVVPQGLPEIDDNDVALEYIRDLLKSNAEIGTDFERRFLDLYFEAVRESAAPSYWSKTPQTNRLSLGTIRTKSLKP